MRIISFVLFWIGLYLAANLTFPVLITLIGLIIKYVLNVHLTNPDPW